MKQFLLSIALFACLSFNAKKSPDPVVSSMSYTVENSQVILITIYLTAPSDGEYQVYVPVSWNDYWYGYRHDDLSGPAFLHQGQSMIQLEFQASDIGISYGITLGDPWFL